MLAPSFWFLRLLKFDCINIQSLLVIDVETWNSLSSLTFWHNFWFRFLHLLFYGVHVHTCSNAWHVPVEYSAMHTFHVMSSLPFPCTCAFQNHNWISHICLDCVSIVVLSCRVLSCPVFYLFCCWFGSVLCVGCEMWGCACAGFCLFTILKNTLSSNSFFIHSSIHYHTWFYDALYFVLNIIK